MVNQIENTRDRILTLLIQAKGETLSGTRISDEAGISRVAVWKHIKGLIAAGAPIDSTPKGYVLADPDDLLLPASFPPDLAHRIFHFQEVATTMDTAKDLARQGAPHMSCIVAEHQTKGRGRLNRQWVSDRGGLWFTLILRPELPPPMAYVYNFAASLTLAEVMNRCFDLDIRVKWPNDLLLGGEKLTGLLSEMETRADLINFLVIGMGVNVNNDPGGLGFKATSLRTALGKKVSRRLILSEFLTAFDTRIQNPDIPELMASWKRCSATLGQQVRVETMNQTHEGRAVDMDDTGALIIETPEGRRQTIIYGDCFHT